jgi:cold shock protein
MSNIKSSRQYEGEVLWFSDKLNYGFIQCTEKKEDGSPIWNDGFFVHFSRIVTTEQFRTLSKGQLVLFDIAESKKGLQAVNVHEKKIVKSNAKVVQ